MTKAWGSAALVAGLLAACGCNTGDTKGPATAPEKKGKEVAAAKGESGHDWWCDEHGVKEEECSMCNAKVAKAFQDKGDWCKEHNRAKSQCFICDPGLKDKYAAEYRAKFGKEPPEPEGQKPEKK
jgi:hypothetical protein